MIIADGLAIEVDIGVLVFSSESGHDGWLKLIQIHEKFEHGVLNQSERHLEISLVDIKGACVECGDDDEPVYCEPCSEDRKNKP